MGVNSYSFLHIINPGYKYHKEISGKERFTLVRNRYQEFKEDGVFKKDPAPFFYIYKIINREGRAFTGIIGAASVDDYINNHIKKHEDTIQSREVLFKEYLDTVGFNAEAVLLTYPDHNVIDQIVAKNMQVRAEYEFTTTYKDTHYLWLVKDEQDIIKIQKAFSEIDDVYIADGHHRSSSSYLLSQDYDAESTRHYFMSYLIPESQLSVYEFNRLVTDLNGMTKEAFLIALDANYRIENRADVAYSPSKEHHFSMYLDGAFYSLYLRKTAYNFPDALSQLDTQILYTTILKPLLGITDLRSNDRIAYSDGKKGMVYVKNQIDQGPFTVGFGMLPLTVASIKAVADAGQTMPPKSTFIEPKLRSGITIYEF